MSYYEPDNIPVDVGAIISKPQDYEILVINAVRDIDWRLILQRGFLSIVHL